MSQTQTNKTEEDLITEAMAALDLSPTDPVQQTDEDQEVAELIDVSGLEEVELVLPMPELPNGPPSVESPTLVGLDSSRHPQQKTSCETCSNSIWFTSPSELKCYCRVMFLITWHSKAPSQITACDGMYLGQEE